ncbi:MAG: hypothetical protein M5U28_24820 [Sandaracinaceae bacterium]|nr:hypothetical protein [Sandaracinaceae bacterium]
MHRSEAVEYEVCASCGAEVRSAERAFAFEESVLCYECAVKRGGAYDETQDRWTCAPSLEGLDVKPD